MKNIFVTLVVCLSLTACSTPKTMMKNEKTGQVVSCGGSATGSLVGGVIGYHIQKSNDDKCVADYAENGFKRVAPAAGEPAKATPAPAPKPKNFGATN